MGDRILRRGNYLRLMALRVRSVAFRREVGNNTRARRAKALGIRLPDYWDWVCGCGCSDDVFVLISSAAALQADR